MIRTDLFNRNPRLRRATLSALALLDRLPPSAQCNQVQFLMLHEVPRPEEEGFCELIARLRKGYSFISYSEAVERIQDGRLDAPYLALSFDDGFASCRRTAALLSELSIPACFFVCPSIIGRTDEHEVRAFCVDRLREKLVRPFLSWDDLDRIASEGHEIGGHSLTHANLALCGPAELRREIAGCYELLSARVGASLKHFCWPFGHFSHINAQAVEMVFDAGFQSCGSGERGCHVHPLGGDGPRSLCIRRDQIVASWPFSHIQYFLNRNTRRASAGTNRWPFSVAGSPAMKVERT